LGYFSLLNTLPSFPGFLERERERERERGLTCTPRRVSMTWSWARCCTIGVRPQEGGCWVHILNLNDEHEEMWLVKNEEL
jgi:hypothetical protein